MARSTSTVVRLASRRPLDQTLCYQSLGIRCPITNERQSGDSPKTSSAHGGSPRLCHSRVDSRR
eukprot:2514462-Pyramimonas_sp.AAC.1